MKVLSSLTTIATVFLFMVYLGTFSGWGAKNMLLQNNQLNPSVIPIPANSPFVSIATAAPTTAPAPPRLVKSITVPKQIPRQSSAQMPATNSTTKTPSSTNSVRTPVSTGKSTTAPVSASTPVPTRTPTPAPAAPPVDNRCIITISGNRYNVTQFRSIHSGGDIFKCGTDMTAVFLSQHPASYLQKMSQYKI